MARVKQGIRMLFFKTGKIQGICLKIVKTCFYTENLLPTREILSKKYRGKGQARIQGKHSEFYRDLPRNMLFLSLIDHIILLTDNPIFLMILSEILHAASDLFLFFQFLAVQEVQINDANTYDFLPELTIRTEKQKYKSLKKTKPKAVDGTGRGRRRQLTLYKKLNSTN